jgi:hypothetical protein
MTYSNVLVNFKHFYFQSVSVELQHAVIEQSEQEGCFVLQDLNSAQGTYVNDCRVQNAAVRLAPGDIIRFGYNGQPYELQMDVPQLVSIVSTPCVPMQTIKIKKFFLIIATCPYSYFFINKRHLKGHRYILKLFQLKPYYINYECSLSYICNSAP